MRLGQVIFYSFFKAYVSGDNIENRQLLEPCHSQVGVFGIFSVHSIFSGPTLFCQNSFG
jgi:hypothetical protein